MQKVKFGLSFTLFLVFFVFSHAQNTNGIVTYEEFMTFGKELNFEENDTKKIATGVDADLKRQLIEQLKKPQQRQFTLLFENHLSKFEEVQKVENDIPQDGIVIRVQRGNSFGYKIKNINEGWYVELTDIFSKEFTIKDDLEKINWSITDETKNIGDYLCIKAIRNIPVNDEEIKKYQEDLEIYNKKGTGLFKPVEPKEREIVAWFTPQIPVGHGPEEFYGLPGLILEVKDQNITYLASKIQLNPKDKVAIKLPNVKKAISKKEFDKIQKEKFDSMKNEDGVIIHQTTITN
jgi:GLPGLI family protein